MGGQWRRDISAALLRSCVGVLLLSPNFLASDFIYSEELPPLLEGAEAGSIILIVIPISDSNYETTPLVKYQFANSPDRPLDRMRKAQRNAALVIGKTVLAIDLVNDDEFQHAFSDGIFWLTLGQSIEPLQLQGELAGFIAGEAKAFASVSDARDQLRRLLDGKSCLLVLDDLWRPQDAEPFDVLGPRSRLLVTTRDADLLVALGARELPLDVLSGELALELLASWSGQAPATLPPAATKVAENCGYLPLALALVGARVQGGASWGDVLAALERGRLEFLDHPYGSVFKSLRLGSDALDGFERDRYFGIRCRTARTRHRLSLPKEPNLVMTSSLPEV